MELKCFNSWGLEAQTAGSEMQCGWHSLSFLSAVTTLPKREKAPCPECFLRRCCPGCANCRWKQGVDVKQQWQKSEGDSMNHLPVLDVWFLCFKEFTFCARFVCMCAGYGAPAETPADKQVSTKRIFGMFENTDHWHFIFAIRIVKFSHGMVHPRKTNMTLEFSIVIH